MSVPVDKSAILAAQAAEKKWGVPASISLAQFGLESAWGTKMPEGSNNPFGMKSPVDAEGKPTLPAVAAHTTEVVHGQTVHIVAWFRKFADLAEAFDAHAELLATKPVYAPAMAVKGNPDSFANALVGRYATDPHYASKLILIMGTRNLYQYDADT